ncbi:hypothetical protein AAKU55_003082 [Oxalobacteraceae bacterium GrIS 1.11]
MSSSEKRKKTDRITVRVAPEELDVLRVHAADLGMPVSAYLLASGLCQKIRSRTNAHLIQQLRLLGIQQKELCIAHGGALTPEYRAVLVEILAAIDRVGA